MEKEVDRSTTKKSKSSVKKTLCTGLILILLAALVGVSVAFYKQKNKQITLEDVQSLQAEEANKVLDEISKHIILPKDEKPTIATITDVDSLRKQMPFFNKAENGFKIIVYTQKAILFDPANNIIVDVAPVVQGANASQQQNMEQEKKIDATEQEDEQKEDVQKEEGAEDVTIEEDEQKVDNEDTSDTTEEVVEQDTQDDAPDAEEDSAE